MYDTYNDNKHDLECLRLASELTQMAAATLNPLLQAHCIRMAKTWSDRVNQGSNGDFTRPTVWH